MLNSFETLRQNMQWTRQALQYIYDNCDEDSEFFEMVSDAKLLFMQANMELENLLKQLIADDPSPQDSQIPHNE